MTNDEISIKPISDKRIVWFQKSNKYVLMNPVEADTLLKIYKEEKLSEIKKWCCQKLNLSPYEADVFIESIQQLIDRQRETVELKSNSLKDEKINSPSDFNYTKFYKIYSNVFFVEYGSAELEFLIHPKFAHLEIEHTDNYCSHFQVFSHTDKFVLKVDDEIIDQWDANNLHFLGGKFSMELLNKMYQKREDDWLGVFHASAISDKENAILFTGYSGNGKSIICSLLMSQGYRLVADDFVPLNNSSMINNSPAALSVKMNAWDVLSESYPALSKVKEYHFKEINKTVKYIPPQFDLPNNSFPVKAIILTKYHSDIPCELQRISNYEALQELIPDSWLSPIAGNAEKFLDWIIEMPCYRLTYSDNKKMVSKIKRLFNDEL